jgi:hypothetical protein
MYNTHRDTIVVAHIFYFGEKKYLYSVISYSLIFIFVF